MRRLSLVIAAAVTLFGTVATAQTLPARALPASVNASPDLPVAAGQASYVTLAGPARDIVVGDPTVADVSLVNDRTLVVMGKKPGVTSLLAFNAGGRPLVNRQVVVSEAGGGIGGVTVYRGASANNYACATQCTRLGAPAGAGGGAPAPTPTGP